MGIRRTAITGAAVVLIVAVVGGVLVFSANRHPGRGTALEAAAAYVAALQSGSHKAVSAVADPGADSGSVIPGLLQKIDGGPLVITSVRSEPTESDHWVALDLTGTLKGQPYTGHIFVRRMSGGPFGMGSGWYVVLGPPVRGVPAGPSSGAP